jgi:hypothetical protein
MARVAKLGGVRGAAGRGGDDDLSQTEVGMVQVELARVRARFAVDPAIPSPLLAGAWTSPGGVVEEDEAEFVDALADCLSVGVPLGAAVASWVSGAFVKDDEDEDEDDDDDWLGSFGELPGPASRRIIVR